MRYSYIFDFDGVLVNTMETHYACYRQALSEAGVQIVKQQFYSQAGMTAIEQIKYFCELAGVERNYQDIYARKRELFKDYIHKAQPIACNLELLQAVKAQGARVAIASGSSFGSVVPVVRMLKIEADVIVTSEDVARGKPNPDLFLLAASKLAAPPCMCIVIEDSDAGIRAAQAACMHVMRFYAHNQDEVPTDVGVYT